MGAGRVSDGERVPCEKTERRRRCTIAGTHVEVLANLHPRRGQGSRVALKRDGARTE